MITKPKGTYDLLGVDAKIYAYLSFEIEEMMTNYNYELIRTPIFESSELFHRSVGEGTDIVSKETYDFKDRGGRSITLRPEGTAGVVRSFIENKLYGNQNSPIKLYYNGTMYRYERPQSGRNREFTQFGVEAFNSDDPLIDAEIISIGYNLLTNLGIETTVALNSLGDAESRKNYTDALVKYFKPHVDSLCEDCHNRINTNPLRILDCKVDKDNDVLKNAPKISDYLSKESKERFAKLTQYLNLLDINYEVDENLVRGLDYYDENVWEYITDDDGITVGGGGRYNHLVQNLGGPSIPAVGMALGIDRIMIKIKENIDVSKIDTGIDVYIMCISEEEKMQALKLAHYLRLNNVATEMNSNNLSMKSQFKAADNMNAKFLIILNNEDLQKGLINIKDNATKEEVKIDEADVIDWIISNI